MNTLKRIFVGIIIIIIALCAVFYSYSAIGNGAVVFATNQDGTLTNDELDVAISSFLQSHGGNIFSPQNYRARKTYEAGLIHNFIYGDGGGYDAVRQHINGGVGGNNELRFDFDGFIIQKLNTWLNRKLQSGDFGAGAELNEDGMFDEGIENQLYDGELFTIDNGSTCLVYTYNGSSNGDTVNLQSRSLNSLNKGSKLQYSGADVTSIIGVNQYYNAQFVINGNVYKGNITQLNQFGNGLGLSYINASASDYYKFNADNILTPYDRYSPFYSPNNDIQGEYCILHTLTDNQYNVGFIGLNYGISTYSNINTNCFAFKGLKIITNSENKENVDINFITNNNNNVLVFPTINEGDTLYITPKVNVGVDGQVNYQPYVINEGDTINNVINQYYIDSNTPDKTISYPSDNPNDNGGGGNDNPSGGTPPDWNNSYPHLSPDGEGGFNFNFTLPDLNIDWNISGLSEKFPFSIPFDLMAFCQILDAEPETPRFEGDLVLPMLTYHIDLNLERFNTIAQLLRNLEFVGFCIGLILITRSMIKG